MRTPLRGIGPPGDNDMFGSNMGDNHRYAMWDAAYVLGSLSSAERREFEAHLADCPSCRSAVGELDGMPALLSQLDRDELAAIDDRGGVEPLLPDELLPSLLAKVSWRRRRSRIVTWTAGTAAAAVLAIGVLVGVAGHSSTSGAHAAAGERVGSADGTGRDGQAGLDGLAQQPAVGNVDLDELCLSGPAERPSRHAGDGRGRS